MFRVSIQGQGSGFRVRVLANTGATASVAAAALAAASIAATFAAALAAAPLGRPREPFAAAATAIVSPSTISGALAIQTGQPSRVGTVWLRFVELTLGLGGLDCGLNTLGSEEVCRLNEGVRREAFDEGARLTGRAVSAEGSNLPGSVPCIGSLSHHSCASSSRMCWMAEISFCSERCFASLQALRRRLRQTRQKKQQQQQHTSSGMHTTCSKKTLLPARAGRRQELEAAWVPTPRLSRVRV